MILKLVTDGSTKFNSVIPSPCILSKAKLEPIDNELAEMWDELQDKEGELTDYIEADDCLTTAAVPTIEQIVDEFLVPQQLDNVQYTVIFNSFFNQLLILVV
ncbi:hypothetical protein DdX_15450 [Ditylenchus destructor]|uniref:Uncharacterized protein n=1 Tax=Ditylenchus destructor TaxID=166010 RepID=A0AAD4MQY9_9BILA|nr:hypothetical protein DdX_15450 [Ditylenchus destructor]